MQTKIIQPKPTKFWTNSPPSVIAVAHRGGDAASLDKENSLKAFQAAYKAGYRWFETDVVPTRDGVLLAIHGRGYQLTPNRDLPPRLAIQRTSYKDIKKLKIGGEPPLMLSRLLDDFPDVKVFLDPKTYKAAPLLAEFLLNRPEDIDRVCVGSFLPFNTSRVNRIVEKNTSRQMAVSILGPLRGVFPLLGFYKLAPTAIVKKYIQFTGAESIHVPYRWITRGNGKKFTDFIHRLNLKVGVYTPNNSNDIKICIENGCDVLMSDKLEILNRQINRQ